MMERLNHKSHKGSIDVWSVRYSNCFCYCWIERNWNSWRNVCRWDSRCIGDRGTCGIGDRGTCGIGYCLSICRGWQNCTSWVSTCCWGIKGSTYCVTCCDWGSTCAISDWSTSAISDWGSTCSVSQWSTSAISDWSNCASGISTCCWSVKRSCRRCILVRGKWGDVYSLIVTSSCDGSSWSVKINFKRSFRIMDDLSFDWNILILFNFSLFGNVFDLFFWDILRNVLSEIFDSIVISHGNFSRNLFDSDFISVFSDSSSFGDSLDFSLIFVFDDFLLEWNVFDSALSFNHFFCSVNNSVNNRSCVDISSCSWSSIGNSRSIWSCHW